MLIVLSGLPGVGKTTVARELARATGAVHVRIDSELLIRSRTTDRLVIVACPLLLPSAAVFLTPQSTTPSTIAFIFVTAMTLLSPLRAGDRTGTDR
jgi:thymidylate kinase